MKNKESFKINYDFPEIKDKEFVNHLQVFYSKITRNPYFKYLKPETHLQIQCILYMKFKYPNVLVHHSPNESRRSTYERWFVSLFGIKSGCPDILIFKGVDKIFCGLAIELKYGKNKTTDNQNKFLNQLSENGWQVNVIYTIEDFIFIVDNYLNDYQDEELF
ncbi:MAG: VRR-NUC domain-containing protein [Sulfurimonas sp.]|jgi:hypothetical protein